ncbi:formylglycine-generating enzyme family protein [Bacillus sp. FJAT-26390]|uniref:formylglycine-generating enzyme family protein n=1 Tax=Bacillus sp. FJAT-26390 TaxID=1743142 RepID=UPI000807E994|nr:formylglycine-generating enzyme family protein [Bacillus sp. FJAT-26390]OBZ13638.1 serine/threonine protein phosphatase [Bacillus sp. FJAT-26390]
MDKRPSCCAAAREAGPQSTDGPLFSGEKNQIMDKPAFENMIVIPAGTFTMGTDAQDGFPADGEGPARQVTVDAFQISPYAVTNAEFQAFIEATGYVTEAERFGWSFVFHLLASEETKRRATNVPQGAPWWLVAEGAYWAAPEGIDSSIDDRMDHPAVHISWHDAEAYCRWAEARLPTEAEWEYAARGGLERKTYPWGDLLKPDGEHRCNIWQGKFPVKNNGSDGYVGTAPVHAYEPNGYGLYNMSGNVWEWCQDWFSSAYHRQTASENPIFNQPTGNRSMRGGSYLCHRSYCNRYRVAARSSNTPDSSTGNCGFRVVRPL